MLLNFILVPNLAKIPRTFGTLGLSCLFRRRITHQSWKRQTDNNIGKEKKIFLIDHMEKWEEISLHILRDVAAVNAIGFDTEWTSKKDKRNPVALLQLATHSGNCVVLRLNHLQGVPSSVKDILEDRQIVKVGVGCDNDVRNLTQDYNINVRGWMDLRHLVLEDNQKTISLGLDSLAKHYLGKVLNKDSRLKLSNWESNILAQRQVAYAAEDSIAGLHILLAQLKKLWNPVLEESWEKSACKAINEICEPFLEMDFNYRFKFDKNSNCEYNSVEVLPQLQTPDGKLLNYCKASKAHWYINRGLGDQVSVYPLIVKLKFKPSLRANIESIYADYLQARPKNCFVCGKENSHIFKNIIPYKYRNYFPDLLLSQIFDVVILCKQCLKTSNLKDIELSQKLAEEFDAHIETDNKLANDINIVRKAGETLKKSRNQLPLKHIQNSEETLKVYFGTDTLTEDLITQAALLQTSSKEQVPNSYKVFKHFEKIGLIHLETRWRQWFLDSMKPKFMPETWSISHNVPWLKTEMSHFPLDDLSRDDYKVALVGTEGEIDVPYVQMTESVFHSHDLNEDDKTSTSSDEFSPVQEIGQTYSKR